MEAEHTAHISGIIRRFSSEAVAKYRTGQTEHGGNLWTKPGMMANLRAEILDLVVYQDTLAEQLEKLLADMRYVASGTAPLRLTCFIDRLDAILHGRSE